MKEESASRYSEAIRTALASLKRSYAELDALYKLAEQAGDKSKAIGHSHRLSSIINATEVRLMELEKALAVDRPMTEALENAQGLLKRLRDAEPAQTCSSTTAGNARMETWRLLQDAQKAIEELAAVRSELQQPSVEAQNALRIIEVIDGRLHKGWCAELAAHMLPYERHIVEEPK